MRSRRLLKRRDLVPEVYPRPGFLASSSDDELAAAAFAGVVIFPLRTVTVFLVRQRKAASTRDDVVRGKSATR